jgi:S-adenosylmethionine hydrolase
MTPQPVPAATVFRDEGAHGSVTGVEPPFGNLETSFGESDLRSLGIAQGDRFDMRCRERTFALVLGDSVDEVAKGEWVGFVSLDGRLMVARYFASAAETSGCRPGDTVAISAGR